ncbi:MAG TPA: HK97-gp10 family putative phage morphogenesis protein [Candidatus Limnocylindrales bacterium]
MARPRMNVTVEGLDELKAKLAQMPEKIRTGAEAAVRDETEEVADDMRAFAPVATGELKDSIQAEVDGLSGAAAATARHATFVEHGTSDTPEQPFALPAAEQSRQRFGDRMREAVGGELKDLTS